MNTQFEALSATLIGKLEALISKNPPQSEPSTSTNPKGSVLGTGPNDVVTPATNKHQEHAPEVITMEQSSADLTGVREKTVVIKIPHCALPRIELPMFTGLKPREWIRICEKFSFDTANC
ncbi:OLC1v1005158C1 [Oldenlandia corymbosa var. corymbosa]|uniref:OLC1v1005158C1 n=1 Tax=Oldenlandia corymbosa var. corymbosa TaxID=529605 RepID=A0AAV1DGY3_OLDCO|nr:OLC1v1005158C1 [Oldenlandia corymbosa var. corymbosa]